MAAQFCHAALRRPVTLRGGRTPLLFYSQVAWDTVWQRPQEEALGLSRYRPVVFLSPVQLHEYSSRLADRWEFLRVLEGGRLIVASPLIFSGEYRQPAVRALNKRIIEWTARRLLGKTRRFFFLTNSPFCAHLVEALRPQRTFIDWIDDFSAFDWAPQDALESQDTLVSLADFAFAGTGYLQREFQPLQPELVYLPSGVKFEALTTPAAVPADIAALPRPRILYVGTLNDRLNGELFAAAARANQEGSVVVVGPKHATFAAPPLPANVHFLGLKPHTDLPGYYQHCDLGIMPFADTPAARAINPIKTLEYLACSLPVLSTPIPDVQQYYDGVVRVEAPERWEGALREMLADLPDREEKARLRSFAEGRTWDSLVKAMERKLREFEGANHEG